MGSRAHLHMGRGAGRALQTSESIFHGTYQETEAREQQGLAKVTEQARSCRGRVVGAAQN